MKRLKILVLLVLVLLSTNSFTLFSGGSIDSYWEMMNYYETIIIKAQSLQSLNAQLKEIERQIELAKKLPTDIMNSQISQYQDTIKSLVNITNATKSVLKDSKKAELWFEDVYKMSNNREYQNLLDKFTNSLNNLSYDAMKTSGMADQAVKSTTTNAQTLVNRTRTATNVPQLLEVLSGWSSNLSTQMNVVIETLSSTSRLKALEEAEKAQARIENSKNSEYTKQSLQKYIETQKAKIK